MRVYFNNYLEILFKVRYTSNLYRIRYPIIIKKHLTPSKIEVYQLKKDSLSNFSQESYSNSIYTLLEMYSVNNDGLYPLCNLNELKVNKGTQSFNYLPSQINPEYMTKNGWKDISEKEYRFPKTYLVEFEGVISQVYNPIKTSKL